MARESVERRLAAILSADVVGYSRLMGEDETGTLAALKALCKELIVPKETQYHGRTIKLMGDGAVGLAVMGGFAWWQPWVPKLEPASSECTALPLPDKPSIAVMPFQNLSQDSVEDYFSDGITEDMIGALASRWTAEGRTSLDTSR